MFYRRFIALPILLALLAPLALLAASCGSGDAVGSDAYQSDFTATSAHAPTQEIQDQVVADATADLNLLMTSDKDTSVLAQGFRGTALQTTTASINQDLAAGKYKKRDYQNLSVTLDDYNYPIAQVIAEFDDNSYYVNANTGDQISDPASDHKKFDLALVEEDGRWKIQGIFMPSDAATPTIPQEER